MTFPTTYLEQKSYLPNLLDRIRTIQDKTKVLTFYSSTPPTQSDFETAWSNYKRFDTFPPHNIKMLWFNTTTNKIENVYGTLKKDGNFYQLFLDKDDAPPLQLIDSHTVSGLSETVVSITIPDPTKYRFILAFFNFSFKEVAGLNWISSEINDTLSVYSTYYDLVWEDTTPGVLYSGGAETPAEGLRHALTQRFAATDKEYAAASGLACLFDTNQLTSNFFVTTSSFSYQEAGGTYKYIAKVSGSMSSAVRVAKLDFIRNSGGTFQEGNSITVYGVV